MNDNENRSYQNIKDTDKVTLKFISNIKKQEKSGIISLLG